MVENSFNIILLDAFENFITFLNSNRVDLKETCSTKTHRTIKLTYPIDDSNVEKYSTWFKHGNKIYIPQTLGMDSCLYVINTEYTIDYWNNNEITVDAEEVLVELNYVSFAHYTLSNESPPEVNKTNLEKWFGLYYDIGEVDPLESTKKVVNPNGNMRLMEFMKLIEESTERVFRTEYSHEGTKITRKLHLKKESNLRKVANTEFLDLNFNLESLELVKDETNSAIAVAPILKMQNQNTTQTQGVMGESDVGSMVSATTAITSTNSMTVEDAKEIYDAWINLEVEYREYVPMIVQKKEGNEEGYDVKAWWYAPFIKNKGEDFIYSPNRANVDYTTIIPYNPTVDTNHPMEKKLFVETTESTPQAIYIVLANSLMKKTKSKFTLKVSVKDIQMLLGKRNLGYQIYETLYVLPPGFDYYVPCYITKTVKNPHMPGENTITLETDVVGTHFQYESQILAENALFCAGETDNKVGGQLVSENGSPIANAIVSINVRLNKPYDKITYSKETIYEFKPETETYAFSESEIQKLEKQMRYDILKSNSAKGFYVMKAVNGRKYSVPWVWCISIYNTRNQIYINNDIPIGSGKFRSSVAVHYYSDNYTQLQTKDDYKYYPSFFYDCHTKITNSFKTVANNYGDPYVLSSELQTGAGCVPAAISNLSSKFKNYKTESELRKVFKTTSNGTALKDILPGLTQLGYSHSIQDLNKNNITNFIKLDNVGALLICDPEKLNMNTTTGDTHALIIYDWLVSNDNKFYVAVMDSNKPIFNPKDAGKYDPTINSWYDIDTLIRATKITETNGELTTTSDNSLKKMIVIKNTISNLPNIQIDEITTEGVFDPSINSYTFSSDEIESVWATYQNKKKDTSVDVNTLNYEIKDTKGVVYKINVDWVNILAYYLGYQYHNNYNVKSKKELTVNTKTGDSATYYKLIKDYNNFVIPYNPAYKSGVAIPYTIATILFRNGVIIPPANLETNKLSTETQNIANTEGYTFNYIQHAINDVAPELNTYIVDYSWNNIQKYTGIDATYSTCLIYFQNDSTLTNAQPEHYRSVNSILAMRHNDSQIWSMVTLATGKSPSNFNNTNEPYYLTNQNTFQLSEETTEKHTKMLVVSRCTLNELEQMYIQRGRK